MADVVIYISTKENKRKQKETLQHRTIPVHLNAAWIPYTVSVNIRQSFLSHNCFATKNLSVWQRVSFTRQKESCIPH